MSNALRLRVTLPRLATPYPRLPKATLGQEGVFQFIEYSDKGKTVASHSYNKMAGELLALIEPLRQLTIAELDESLGLTPPQGEEGQNRKLINTFKARDFDQDKVLAFINTYGQMGRANLARREKFERRVTIEGYEMSVDEFCSRIAPGHRLSRTQAEEYYQANKKKLKEHCWAIATGARVPWHWIEADIRTTGRAIRALAVINEYSKTRGKRFIPLEDGDMLRDFLGAIEKAPFEILYPKKGHQIQRQSPAWKPEPKKVEQLVASLLSDINALLQPLTRTPLQSDFDRIAVDYEANYCVESYLLYSILTTDSHFIERPCLNCGRPTFAERSTRIFCSPRCGASVRQKRHRQKKKQVSTSTSGKKKTPRQKGQHGKTKKASKTVRH
jgi:endogenous inhibitor of DNA gyrase (YacG/DUF329 family)